MPLFVVLAEGAELDDELTAEIAKRIRERCSPRHVPDRVYAIAEVPRTLSGKVLEVPVKRILTGTPVEQAASRDSLANPAALDFFVELATELASAAPDASGELAEQRLGPLAGAGDDLVGLGPLALAVDDPSADHGGRDRGRVGRIDETGVERARARARASRGGRARSPPAPRPRASARRSASSAGRWRSPRPRRR